MQILLPDPEFVVPITAFSSVMVQLFVWLWGGQDCVLNQG